MRDDAALLKLTAKRDALNLMQGRHFASHLGEGYDIAELRAYQSGDDVRKIAWNITAKTGQLHVKEMHDSRRLNVAVAALLDGGMFCGKDNVKQHLVARIALTLGYAALFGSERFMGMALTPTSDFMLPPTQEQSAPERLAAYIADVPLLHTVLDVNSAVTRLNASLLEPSLLVIIGDFMQTVDLSLLAQRHDIVVVKVRCTAEAYGDFLGEKSLHNPLNGQQRRRYLGIRTQKAYLARLQRHDEALHAHFYTHRIRFTQITPEDSIVKRLMEAFEQSC